MEIFIGWIILSFVAGAIGNERRIGFASAFFLSLFLSPLVGLICALASKSKSQIQFENAIINETKRSALELSKVAKSSFTDELFKLKTLLDSGLITIEEFENEKEKIKTKIEPPKTILALYNSIEGNKSSTLQVKIGRGEFYENIPEKREDSIKYEVNPGQVEITISPAKWPIKKTVFLEVLEGTTAYYDVGKIYEKA
ncbi:SHOCT domain-containing protein [Sphingobacterium sp. Lzh-3]|uniref:SHOCT domain-containing protein n=1 Tax=Sphingobacterium sp. Lzh-3 TaxID=3382150 RepID=UPI00398D4CB9